MNVFREYTRYVILNVLGMLGLSCYILADTFFVAQGLGSDGLAALNLAIPVYSFIHGTGLMLGIGGGARYSIQKGMQDGNMQNRIFTHTIVTGICFAVFFVIAGVFFSDFIAQIFGAEGSVFSMCKTYLQVMLLFSPAILLNDIILCFVRNDGAPQLSMAAMLTGSFCNIILDFVFIFLFGWGIFGAVFATGLAPVISLLILSVFFVKKKNHFSMRPCKGQMKLAAGIMAGGIPSLIGEVSSGVVMMIFNMVMLRLGGNTGVAAYGVVANLSLVVIVVYTGIAQGIQPLVSLYYGYGKVERIRKIFGYAVCTVLLLSAVIYGSMAGGAEWIVAVFNSERNQQMQQLAVQGIRFYFTACVFAGFNIVVSIYFAGIGLVREANTVSLLRGFVLIIPVTFFMAAIGGVTGLWLAFPAAELLTALIGVMLFWKSRRRRSVG